MIAAYLKEIKAQRRYLIAILLVIFFSYIVYAFCSDEVLLKLGEEDGFFEWMTAIFFLISSVLFLILFRRTKNIFLLGLAFIFFFGAGEEISWGQRLFNFGTPESLNKVNVQHEFNIHNLEIFNDQDLSGVKKTGWKRLLEINILFRIFSVCFLVVVPFFFYHINRPRIVVPKWLRMPVASSVVGIFFFISWLIFYALKYAVLPRNKEFDYYLTVGEVFEFTAAFVWFLTALYFFNDKEGRYLGNDIKRII